MVAAPSFAIVTEAGNGTRGDDWMVKEDGLIVFIGSVFECCRYVAARRT